MWQVLQWEHLPGDVPSASFPANSKKLSRLQDFIIISLKHLLALRELRPLAGNMYAFIHVPLLYRLNDSCLIIYRKESSFNVFTQFATVGGGCQSVSACVIAWDIEWDAWTSAGVKEELLCVLKSSFFNTMEKNWCSICPICKSVQTLSAA